MSEREGGREEGRKGAVVVPARAERHSRADQPPGNSYLSSGFVFLVFRGFESGPLMA